MSNQFLTSGEVAKRLRVHRTSVHHWARAGKLRTAQIANGIRLFALEDVEELEAQRAAPAVVRDPA